MRKKEEEEEEALPCPAVPCRPETQLTRGEAAEALSIVKRWENLAVSTNSLVPFVIVLVSKDIIITARCSNRLQGTNRFFQLKRKITQYSYSSFPLFYFHPLKTLSVPTRRLHDTASWSLVPSEYEIYQVIVWKSNFYPPTLLRKWIPPLPPPNRQPNDLVRLSLHSRNRWRQFRINTAPRF